ncbi:Methyltransferase-like protein 7A [Liparis tanakae]|uniref:Methyltransferase-like protein 7A n=1 Tax=Liparis tanakae TaxID=230148 RepID=A0A4Z2IU61_9TELE|nr:Methyltransferase-like protein 7A [Liparis tanakae]
MPAAPNRSRFCEIRYESNYNKNMYDKKKELFRSLSEFNKPGGQLTILEIGTGTGTNFEFFPPGSKVICTDPNPHFQRYLNKSMGENDRLSYGRFMVSSGEDMGSVESGSVDVVVCTLVLCSVNSIPQTLREVRRMLRPIGCGSGANFKFYPCGCTVICTDPNPHFERYLRMSMDANTHLTFGPFLVVSGEAMEEVDDESVDVVVCTLVLCSVANVQRVLREVRRILKTGGAFYFLEHVVSDPSSCTYFLQHVFEPLWYYLGDGCMVTRATWKDLEAAGFSELHLKHVEAPELMSDRHHHNEELSNDKLIQTKSFGRDQYLLAVGCLGVLENGGVLLDSTSVGHVDGYNAGVHNDHHTHDEVVLLQDHVGYQRHQVQRILL